MSGSITPTTFTYTGKTVTWTVPTTGLYDITAAGAKGGNGAETRGFLVIPFGTSSGGPGALMGGDFELTQGEVLTIAVGGRGANGVDTGGYRGFLRGSGSGGGGGGGSFVAGPGSTPLVIAGGGGGGGGYRNEDDGGPGLTGTAGGNGGGEGGGRGGGTNGAGGSGSVRTGGGGGGGFKSSGGVTPLGGGRGGGGYPSLQGGRGGENGASGGFGGGGGSGSSENNGGGGGGGYSGGGGGGGKEGGGGGGGSYLAPGAIDPVEVQGQNQAAGDVTIALVSAADPSGGDPPAATAGAGTDPPATSTSTAASAADQASFTSSTLGQASMPGFLTANPAQPTSSIVLQPGSVDQLTGFGFDPSTEVLDLRQALAASHLTLGGNYGTLASYVQVTDTGGNATLSFNPQGFASGPGSALAQLFDVGPGVTLATLISGHALAIT